MNSIDYLVKYESIFTNESDGVTAVLLMAFIALIVIYFWLFCLAIKRCYTIFRDKEGIKIAKWYFVIINLLIFMRVSSFSLLSYIIIYNDYLPFDDSNSQFFVYEYFVSTFYLPDLLFVICYAVLAWILFMLFQLATINADSFKNMETRFRNKYFKIWLFCLFTLTITQIVTFLIFWLKSTTDSGYSLAFILENSIMNLIGPFYMLSVEIYYHFAYSGIPYISQAKEERLKSMNGIIIIWSFSRVLDATVGIFEYKNENNFVGYVINYLRYDNPTLLQILLLPGLFLIYVFICEVIPLALILDSKKLENFLIQSEMLNAALAKGLVEDEDTLDANESSPYKNTTGDAITLEKNPKSKTSLDAGNSTSNATNSWNNLNPTANTKLIMMKDKNIWIDKDPISAYKTDNKLGVIKKAMLNGEILIARIVTLTKITPYLIEDMKKEIPKLNALENINLLKIRGFYADGNTLVILYDYAENGSLYNLLHNKNKPSNKSNNVKPETRLSEELKNNIALQIALAIQFLHRQNPPLFHGHLTSNNIFLDSKYNVKIMDYGLTSLKKLASVMLGYSNISQYTPPELLQDRPKTIIGMNSPVDIYSYGMLLWEIYTEQEPFQGLSLKDIYQVVCKDKSRPKISNDMQLGLQNLIRACWQQDPMNRPTIDDIIGLLNKSFSDSHITIDSSFV